MRLLADNLWLPLIEKDLLNAKNAKISSLNQYMPWAIEEEVVEETPRENAYAPNSLALLCQTMREAFKNGKRVRIVGKEKAWKKAAPEKDVLIYLDCLDPIERQKNANVSYLLEVLESYQYDCPFSVVIEKMDYNTIVSPDDQQFGWNGSLGDIISWIDFANENGDIKRFEERVMMEEENERENIKRTVNIYLSMFVMQLMKNV